MPMMAEPSARIGRDSNSAVHSPPLQRERSQEEMEIARHLIEHSQSGVSSVTSSAQTQRQPQRSYIPPGGPSLSDSGASELRESRELAMQGADEAYEQSSSDEHHDLGDSLASSVTTFPLDSATLRTDTPSQRGASQAADVPSGQACRNCGTTKTPLWRRSPTGEVICNACGLYYKARQQMRPVGLKRGAAAVGQANDTQRSDRALSSLQSQATYVSADPSSNGTCPGGGRCNGTGGHDGCNGCPAYNNRISKTAQVALQQTDPNVQPGSADTAASDASRSVNASVIVACQNCGTTITPLWRRDEAGNTICNACGLYYKLHGAHRPVRMKKAEIKRRKRVVPANATGAGNGVLDSETMSTVSGPTSELRASVAPSTVSSLLNHDDTERPARGPIPVDFTSSFRTYPRIVPVKVPASPRHHQAGDEGRSRTPIIPQKRSMSPDRAGESALPHPNSRSPSRSEMHYDPVLASPGPSLTTLPPISSITSPMTTSKASTKEARRAELQRESERMRLLLLQNERELAELGDDRQRRG